jgi:hypothetical protein
LRQRGIITGAQHFWKKLWHPSPSTGRAWRSTKGLACIAELHFLHDVGPALFGNRQSLLDEWSRKIRGAGSSDFVREGF